MPIFPKYEVDFQKYNRDVYFSFIFSQSIKQKRSVDIVLDRDVPIHRLVFLISVYRYRFDENWTDIIPIRVPIWLNLLAIYLSVSQGSRVHSARRDNQPPTLIQVLRACTVQLNLWNIIIGRMLLDFTNC